MKKTIACIAILSHMITANATTSKQVKSSIKNVTVFLNGAQIHREASIQLKKGMIEFSFDSLSPNINSNSIQVSGLGDFIILDTKYMVEQPNYNQQKEIPKDLENLQKRIQDTIDLVNFNLEELRFKKEVLETEKQLLTGNKSMKSDSLALLKDALAFFREKYNDINSALIKVKRDEYKVNKRIGKLQTHLQKVNEKITKFLNSGPKKPNHKVVITASCDGNYSGKLLLDYMVSNASWSPSYDLRAKKINEPVALTYKANIYQNTGENWDNVKLKLSTNNPYRSKVKPILPPWYLNYYSPVYSRTQTAVGGILKNDDMDFATEKLEEQDLKKAKGAAYYTAMTESFTNVEFKLGIPYTINADGKSHTVAIKEEKLKTDFKYYMVPKMDENAFLVAQLKGFEELNLLPGSSNIYFNGTYIGQTMLNPKMTGDSLAIDFGREERIFAKRKQLKTEDKDKLLGKDKVKLYNYEILVKNNLVAAIDLIVEENYPIPSNKEIKVELTNDGKSEVKKETGMLTWKFNLPSKTYKKLKFGYEVQYPKDKQLAMIN